MKRLEKTFLKRTPLLSIYTIAGYPPDSGLSLVEQLTQLEKAGVDLVELGFPFSDPVADGETIQKACQEASKGGMTLENLFLELADLRKTVSIPVMLMGYYNPIMQFGLTRCIEKAASVGLDGFIIPDLPPPEYNAAVLPLLQKNNLGYAFLVTPQTPDSRIRYLDSLSRGFIYAVSHAGVTGGSLSITDERESYLKRLKEMKLTNPILCGFGISDAQSFNSVGQFVNGSVIGSAFLRATKEKRGTNLLQAVTNFVHSIRPNH